MNMQEKIKKGKSRSIRYLIIFTICWITGFVLALAWCTRAQAHDGGEALVQKINVQAELLNYSYLYDLNTTDGTVSNSLPIFSNHLS
jgi:hypothetical protein